MPREIVSSIGIEKRIRRCYGNLRESIMAPKGMSGYHTRCNMVHVRMA